MVDTLQSMSLVTVMEIVGPIVLGAAMIYASIQWSRRRRATAELSEAATRDLYRHAARKEHVEAVASNASARSLPPEDELPVSPRLRGELRSGREEGRWTEDEIARKHLGVAGQDDRSKPKALAERETQINKHLDPGHTS
jgi:hypothetical protein